MFTDDMSPMPSMTLDNNTKRVAIGWLDCSHQFTKGETCEGFQDKLRQLCLTPLRRTRGFHLCPFCKTDDVRGNGEIDVAGVDGVAYVAPSLIWHYVVKHGYQPPNEFVEAVMATNVEQIGVGQLSLAVARVADEPTVDNQFNFCQIFVKSHVGVRVPAEFGTVPSGDYITNSNNKVSIPLARLPDGTPMLLVLADVDKLAKLETGSTFMQLGVKDVINMAIQNNTGIIVQASAPCREAWAALSPSDVVNLRKM